MYNLIKLILLVGLAQLLVALAQVAVAFPPKATFTVAAGEVFTISHVPRTAKMRLQGCQDARKEILEVVTGFPPRAPHVINYSGWRNAANTAQFRVPLEAKGCTYEITDTVVAVE